MPVLLLQCGRDVQNDECPVFPSGATKAADECVSPRGESLLTLVKSMLKSTVGLEMGWQLSIPIWESREKRLTDFCALSWFLPASTKTSFFRINRTHIVSSEKSHSLILWGRNVDMNSVQSSSPLSPNSV